MSTRFTHRVRRLVPLGALAIVAACGPKSEDVQEIRNQQKLILAKLSDLEKKLDQVGARPPAAGRPEVDPNKVYDIPLGNSAFKGPADAPVVITEFSDFQCPFCSQAAGLLEQVVKDYPKDVKFVYKQFPLTSIHPFALDASRAALAAGKQGKFWEMHDQLFANNRALQKEKLSDYAKTIGVDVAKFETDMNSPEVQAQIQEEMKQAANAQVTGTPTIFVNGKRLMNRSPEGFHTMIDQILKEKKAG
ncbi:MAG TPA: thioredoxin domain-containing protein [Candidatus Kryptonia bacterium]|nr:thioredoxin domain-containing protein [Candidatus Kryptonia bacterium]